MALFQAVSAFGGDTKYPVSAIPEELKANANVVVREKLVVFTIASRSKASIKVLEAITILNEKGSLYATRTVGYDKLEKITDFSATVYDAAGKQIKKLRTKDISDQSAYDGFSLYSDQRIKSATLAQANYPYTVEFEYEVEYKYLYSIPGAIIAGEKKSIQHTSYQLIYPPEFAPRYITLNIGESPKKEKLSDGRESVSWSFENVKPVTFEPHGPRHSELLPQILAAPTSFEYDGFAGSMVSWKEYGAWNAQLINGREELPEATKQRVRELTKGLTTVEQKAKGLYEFLQNRTRYVSIQEGVGGLQPFAASVVDETGYGDCKALSNYMVALLKEAGVKGYYTQIRAGENEPDILLDFPSHQSNHIIVAVPSGKDTLWMECTSQKAPFGYLGSFTGDRSALMITEEGGKMVRTPSYKAEQNKQSRFADVVVDVLGNAKATVRTTYSGMQYENGGLDGLLDNQYDDQKKWVQDNTHIPSFSVNTFSMKGIKSKIPSAFVNLDLTLNRYASASGKRLFIAPNLMNRVTFIPEKVEDRQTAVVRYSNYLDLDTVTFHFPEILYPEFLPQAVKIYSRFGEYETSYQLNAGTLVYIRKMKVWKGRFPKDSYNELIDFYKNVNKSDNMKLVFVNKT